jgi:5'-nucleotidase
MYVCNGTPADCIKMAITQLLDRIPDWVVSGINHGSNSSASVLYSGTMGAAIEGCINGITSVGFSLDSYSSTADFSACKKYIREIMQMLTQGDLPQGICLNVNIPDAAADEIRGIKICRHAQGSWKDDFEKRIDPMGKAYYWLTGVYENHEPDATDTDEWALANKYVSVAPVSIDMTAYKYLDTLRERFKQ